MAWSAVVAFLDQSAEDAHFFGNTVPEVLRMAADFLEENPDLGGIEAVLLDEFENVHAVGSMEEAVEKAAELVGMSAKKRDVN